MVHVRVKYSMPNLTTLEWHTKTQNDTQFCIIFMKFTAFVWSNVVG